MKPALRNYNFIKGKIAEAIVERLFLTMGFDVYPYGIEKKLPPALLRLHRKMPRRLFQRSENDPDFFIMREADNDFNQSVEVKFRANGKIEAKDLAVYDPDTLFILVDPRDLFALHAKELGRFGKSVDFNDCVRLAHHNLLPLTSKERWIVRGFAPMVVATLGQCLSQEAMEKTMYRRRRRHYREAFAQVAARV